jgi:GT2 family glycosyltransferase
MPLPFRRSPARMPCSFRASVVVFESDRRCWTVTLAALDAAIAAAAAAGLIGEAAVTVVDNNANAGALVEAAYALAFRAGRRPPSGPRRAGQGNVGYGRGHNLVLSERVADVYLVLNPDAVLAPDALLHGLTYCSARRPADWCAPFAAGPDGAPQFLCKRYPDVLTLKLRAIAPR